MVLNKAVLTPHRQELALLLGCHKDEIKFEKIQRYVDKHCAALVYKGYPTFIFFKDRVPIVIARGDPGMATAGTGDALTGIITAFLAQGLSIDNAAILGVFMHALAGEMAALEKTSYSLIASDLIECLPKVFARIGKDTNR